MNRWIYRLILFRGSKIVGWEDESVCIENGNGNNLWYRDGFLHRKNGPVVEFSGGDKWWCINGQRLTEKEFNNR